MHLRRDGADDGAHKSRQNTVTEAVLTRNGAESGRERKAVDVRLSGECPRDIKARDKADYNHNNEERDISDHNGEDVSHVLAVRRKG